MTLFKVRVAVPANELKITSIDMYLEAGSLMEAGNNVLEFFKPLDIAASSIAKIDKAAGHVAGIKE